MRKILAKRFFDRPTLKVARELLGKYLVRRVGKRELVRRVSDVEAYIGFNDQASHASAGRTTRNSVMFGRAGMWYVYFTYGMHWMLNIVTDRPGFPAAILIRGVEGISGPGRVTKFFKVDKRFNAQPASPKTGLWLEDRGKQGPSTRIRRSKRIGVSYAGPWQHKLWRFSLR